MVRSLYGIVGVLVITVLTGSIHAEAFKLASGETLNGDILPTTANEQGVQIKVGEGDYQKVPWSNFSQEDLRKFANNQRMEPFVEPFIEVSQAEKIKKTEVNIKEPPRLPRPAKQSLLSALFSSAVGVLVLLVLYAAVVYAGYEVAIFRAQPPILVCGLAAIPLVGVLSPIIFLAMPTRISKTAAELREAEAAAVSAAEPIPATAADEVNPMKGDSSSGGLKIAHTETGHDKPKVPDPVIFQRGQFTFNRRFIETKFPGFFGIVRREADRDMVLAIKTSRGEYAGQRISRIAANDMHLEVQRGSSTEEVLIPFQEIQQIILRHKDA
ncbi:MAG TPA: hypothetical protein VKY92_25340 [Verrucomicrobiae bacterium]|jgi:hypothetical protein|nr:hypothetical protein [Verrucomicrobiae bacterium]